jgi:glyoxylase-like metal-dependent hydrolase (beta-lactamase superfamily II)
MSAAAAAGLPVRTPWFSRLALADGVTRISEPSVNPFLRANIWHVAGRDRDLLVDTGMGIASLRRAFPDLFDREPVVFVTHGHYDHTGGAHEFTDRRAHEAEAAALENPEEATLVTGELPPSFAAALAADSPEGVPPSYLVDAVPDDDYEINDYVTIPAPPTTRVIDGDVIDLGDRALRVVHLPGHTPGSAGLFEEETGLLFSGDVLYDGELLDELPESNIEDYVRSMRRLASIPANAVHAGHEESFGPDRMHELLDEYLTRRG